jgi:hypothetical protein
MRTAVPQRYCTQRVLFPAILLVLVFCILAIKTSTRTVFISLIDPNNTLASAQAKQPDASVPSPSMIARVYDLLKSATTNDEQYKEDFVGFWGHFLKFLNYF